MAMRSLVINTGWNVIGQFLPLFVAVWAIPLLINGVGTERFGILTLIWAFIGYFGLLDMGVGRALTKIVADRHGACQTEEIETLEWTGLLLAVVPSVVGGILVACYASPIVLHVLKVSPQLQAEAATSIVLMAGALPFVVCTTIFRGILEGSQRFDIVNSLRIPFGLFTYLAPLAFLSYYTSLSVLVAVLVVGQVLGCVAHLWGCVRVQPSLLKKIVFSRNAAGQLLRLGGWMTVSNVLGPLMTYLDRFIISSLISLSLIAFYTTPYEVIIKFWIIPAAVCGALFPILSSKLATERENAARIYDVGTLATSSLMCLFMVGVVLFAQEILTLWLGVEFASKSADVLRLLAVGVALNTSARFPFALLQAGGRADLTAKFHFFELPLYIFSLVVLTSIYGITGAAIAWSMRIIVDALILFKFAKKLCPEIKSTVFHVIIVTISFVGAFVTAYAVAELIGRLAIYTLATMIMIIFIWKNTLTLSERTSLMLFFKKVSIGDGLK